MGYRRGKYEKCVIDNWFRKVGVRTEREYLFLEKLWFKLLKKQKEIYMKNLLIIAVLFMGGDLMAKETKPAPTTKQQTLKADKTKGKVVFEAVGKPSFLKIKGEGIAPEGEVSIKDKVTGKFTFKMSSLDTGIGLRNEHMKDKYLEVGKFPTAELKIEDVTKFDPEKSEQKALPFEGTLTIHGVTKPIQGTVDVQKKGKGYSISAGFEAKITDYAIAIPSYAGITVADSVKVSVSSELL
jgi:polyisoprenoid-binding protein YceI